MTQITLDPELAARLGDLLQPVELCDPSGRVLGCFVPAAERSSQWEAIGPDVSEQELDRREQSNERHYSTTEVVARLESL
jgi:hypothetical protein